MLYLFLEIEKKYPNKNLKEPIGFEICISYRHAFKSRVPNTLE